MIQLFIEQQTGHADYGIEGSSYLMAHIGQELGLCPGGRFGLLFGLLQVLFRPLSLRHLGYALGQKMIALIKDHLLADEHQGDKKAEGGCNQGIVDLTQKLLFPDEEEEYCPNA